MDGEDSEIQVLPVLFINEIDVVEIFIVACKVFLITLMPTASLGISAFEVWVTRASACLCAIEGHAGSGCSRKTC